MIPMAHNQQKKKHLNSFKNGKNIANLDAVNMRIDKREVDGFNAANYATEAWMHTSFWGI